MEQTVNVVIPPLAQAYTYLIPQPGSVEIEIGDRVLVPLGSRSATGFVIEKRSVSHESIKSSGFALKSIADLDSVQRCFNASDLAFFSWVAAYYGEPLANVLDVAVPKSVPARQVAMLSLDSHDAPSAARGKLQQLVIDQLRAAEEAISHPEMLKRVKGSAGAVKKLLQLGVIRAEKKELLDQHLSFGAVPSWTKADVRLNSEQEQALSLINGAIKNKDATPLLLHGITGSGKTEVYIDAIKYALELGLGALVLVPEIALTPQLIDRFRARLGNKLAVLHSALSRRIRWDSWRALLEKRNMVAIGARSAVFAPVPNLGLIVVDEEHDPSYKQNDGLRYSARDLAVARAKFSGCPVVLGSATPSLESFSHANKKKYIYVKLSARHKESAKINVEIVDLKKIKPWQMPSKNISPRLAELIGDALGRGKQAFILYNRRGFATYLQCEGCERVIECPNCSVTMTYHQRGNTLLCHYCNATQLPPAFCDSCNKRPNGSETGEDGRAKFVRRGAGTEKVYEELQELFPEVRIDRLDRDAASSLDRYKTILDNVRSGATSILVGTQMIAKGHDIPDVTLVGVVDCDVGLHMPDFRAAERAYQLLTQASGRAGRDEFEGRVVLQTRLPQHPSLVATALQTYEKFAAAELFNRRNLHYPPFVRLLRVIVQSADKDEAAGFLKAARQRLDAALESKTVAVAVLGPALAPIEKIKTKWRWHMLIKSRRATELHKAREIIKSLKTSSKKLQVIYDLDPQDML